MENLDLDAGKVVQTVERLELRIGERFPDAGLRRVAQRLASTARATVDRMPRIRRSNLFLRLAIALLIAAIPLSLAAAVLSLGLRLEPFANLEEFVAFFQASVESLIFIGAGVVFLVTVEIRMKRRRVLSGLHELRVLAHLVDMHQLDKDPIYVLNPGPTTASSPKRTMTAFQLNRYLDYCCEMLALIGKLAALYGKDLEDGVALSAADDVESLTNGLSRKIWQKEMLLDRAEA